VNRVRPVEALLAAVATLAVTLPLTTLFTPSTWFRPSVLLVVVVALVGMGLRRITANRPLVVLGQVVLLVNATSLLHGRGHLFAGVLPTPETGRAFGILLQEAQTTVTNYTAPAPSNRATILAISLLIGLTAVAVDAIGVTYRSPALAGIPLLSAFLASATNSGDGLGAWYAVPGALAWLALVGRQGVRSLRAWGTASPHSSSGPLADPTTAFATLGRVVGVGALGVAIVLPGLVPHFPTTFLADGLGRSADGRGGSGSNIRLASSIDIARDLGSRSSDPVFRYRSTSDRLEPLRVGILDTYRRGQWGSSSDFTFVPVDGQIPGPTAGPEVPRRVERISVVENAIGVPQVALPPGAVGTPFPAGTWNMTVQGVVQLTAPATSYTTEFVELDPEDGQFSADLDNPQIEGDELEVDPAAEAEVRKVLDEITDDGDSALQIARKVQGYLRGPTFTYSLELADQAADGNLSDEPLARFLETKRGYCVQFTSAMVMLSRAAGIPARMAVGFLPGSIDGDDRVVKVSDAHAWPELYFPRLGWVRFEPTPGTRSGVAPEYSSEPLNGGSSASASPTTSSSTSSATPSTSPSRDVTADQTGTTTGSAGTGAVRFVTQHVTTILVLLLALLIAAIVPFGAWLSRRRARAAARDDADRVEAEWQSLLLRLQDIGFVPPDGATPRQTSRTIGHDAYLTPDENDALGRVVTTLERARYARPGAELVDVSDDARTVWRGALSRRRRADRARAMLLPEEGKRMWRGLGRSLLFWRDRGPDVPPDD
jgi:transglutaminase-like putative cysteine protease